MQSVRAGRCAGRAHRHALLLALIAAPPLQLSAAANTTEGRALAAAALEFVENVGQWEHPARFAARGGPLGLAFEERAIAVHRPGGGAAPLRFVFEDASPAASLAGEGRRPGHYNFYLGRDPARWRARVPSYGELRYRGLYDGVDVRVHAQGGRPTYDVVLSPGADLERVVVRCDGVTGLELAPDGGLVLRTPAGPLRQTPPRTWEVLPNGEKRPVPSRFRLLDGRRYGFEAPGRDRRRALVVDPGLEWSTYLGGRGSEFIQGVAPAPDGTGEVIVAGFTGSPDFPLVADPTFAAGQTRVFVARLTASGSALRYATFLGGWFWQGIFRGLAVDAAGGTAVAGQTFSPDYPTTPGALDDTLDYKDAFVSRLDPAGVLVFSTLLGGAGEDLAVGVGFDPSGEVVVGGTTGSPDFPTTANAFEPGYNTPNDPADGGAHGDWFISRLSADGTRLTYSTFLGGPQMDVMEDMVVDAQGVATAVGWVTGNNVQVFVTTPDAFDATWNGSQDGALARLELGGAGSADLKYATLIGGASQDNLLSVALDPADPTLVTVAGSSWSDDYPVTAGVVRTTNPRFSALFASQAGTLTRFRLPATGPGALVWSSYHHARDVSDVAVSGAGEPIVIGIAGPDFPTTPGAMDRTASGTAAAGDPVITRLSSDASRYAYATYFGGNGGDFASSPGRHPHLAWAGGHTVLVAGATTSTDFRTTPLAFDMTTNNPDGVANDGFVMRVTLDPDASGDLAAEAPAPLSPPDGASFAGGGLARLEWSEVTDPSGVEAYEFQMSSGDSTFSPDFIRYRGSVRRTSVVLPPGGTGETGLALSTWYWRVRMADFAGNLSPWSTTRSFTLGATGIDVSFVEVHPSSVVGGQSATGMIHLVDPAPPGGLTAKLSVHFSRFLGYPESRIIPLPVSVPATVDIPAGAYTVAFPITTDPVTDVTGVEILVAVDGIGEVGRISVNPAAGESPTSLTFNPAMVVGGTASTGTVTLARAAPAGGAGVGLTSTHPSAAQVPATVTVPEGATSASFAVTTAAVSVDIDATIVAERGGQTTRRPLYVRPPNQPTLASFELSATGVAGGTNVSGTVTFSGPIPLGTWPAYQDGVVTFASSDPQVAAAFPGSEFVPAGSTGHTFGIFTRGVPDTRVVTLTATYGGRSLSRTLTVEAVAPLTLSSLALNVSTVAAGQGGIGTVLLSTAPAGSTLLTLSSSHPGILPLPPTLLVAAGSTSASFSFVTTTAVTATTSVTLTASFGESAVGAVLTVNPPKSATPPAVSVTLDPRTVAGGTSSTGTLTLGAAAPAGGAVAQLFSSNTGAATVPATVTVPEGAASVSFPVTTSGVSADAVVQIGALLHLSPGATLTVTAPPAPPPTPEAPSLLSPANDAKPPQPVTFDWTDVEHAATYTIHVDDSDRFSSPLVVDATVTASQFTTCSLATRRHWWRVRAANSAGTAGPWSTVRRLEPQACSAASLSSLGLGPTSVVGGNSSTGTATLSSAAPSGGAVVSLSSNNSAVGSVPASVTVAAGATGAGFTVTTSSVTAATSVTISGTYSGVTRSASLTVNPPAGLTGLSLSPTGVTGGDNSTGTVTLSSAVPAGGATVALSSGNTAVATVPESVTVAGGATTASFAVTTSSVTSSTSLTVSAALDGVTKTATLTVNAAAADSVSIQTAEYDTGKQQVRVDATSTSSSATLKAYVTSTDALIGTLGNEGGGRYRGEFAWPTDPQSITVRSSLGGSASKTVTRK